MGTRWRIESQKLVLDNLKTEMHWNCSELFGQADNDRLREMTAAPARPTRKKVKAKKSIFGQSSPAESANEIPGTPPPPARFNDAAPSSPPPPARQRE